MLFLPPEGGNLAVQDLDRPPLGHNRDGTSALANRNTGALGAGVVLVVLWSAVSNRTVTCPGQLFDGGRRRLAVV